MEDTKTYVTQKLFFYNRKKIIFVLNRNYQPKLHFSEKSDIII